jgi:formamidopyrimidine-DNA glycosylase
MPELPEVEYTARQLRATIVGKTIQNVDVFWSRTIGYPDPADFVAEVAGREVVGVRRRGKFLLIDLSGDLFLSIHRRMTGNFFWLPAGWEVDTSLREEDARVWDTKGPMFERLIDVQEGRPKGPHSSRHAAPAPTRTSIPIALTRYCRVCFNFVDGERLLFTDPRKFGRIELWPQNREAEAFAGLGPEPLGEEFTVEGFREALAKRKVSIKQALLDQTIVVGVGNIYADEALFYAYIHPLRSANLLALEEVRALRDGIVHVLTLGIEHGGTSFNDYRDLWGEAGENYNHVLVYQKDGQPCARCGTPIERRVIAQRSAHFCPHCQP